MTDGLVPPVPFDGSETLCILLIPVKNALPAVDFIMKREGRFVHDSYFFEEMIDTNRISAYNNR